MSDQPVAFASLADFFRSFARAELDRAVEEKLAESRERGRRLYVKTVSGSLDFLEVLYGFLRDDVRRLEQRLDEIHVSIERRELRGIALRLENSRYKHDEALAARDRLLAYLSRLDDSIGRIANAPEKESLQTQSADLRRRADDLAAPLAVAGSRLDRYSRVASERQ